MKFTAVISVVPKGLCISPKPNIILGDAFYIYFLSSERVNVLKGNGPQKAL